MGLLSKFENKMEDGIEGAAGLVGRSGLSPVQITKRAEKQMRREKIVGAGKQYAPTLYTVLVSSDDDSRLFRYYPTLAGEVETYLAARASELGFVMDGAPLVRFICDPELKRGKFDVVAEMVAASIVEQLRDDEMRRYGLPAGGAGRRRGPAGAMAAQRARSDLVPNMQPLVNLQQPLEDDIVPVYEGQGVMGAEPADVDNEPYAPRQYGNAGMSGQSQSGEAQYGQAQMDARQTAYGGQPYDQVAYGGQPYDQVAYGGQPGQMAPLQARQDVPAQPQNPPAYAAVPSPGNAPQPDSHSSGEVAQALDVYLYDEARDRAYTLTGASQRIGRGSGNEVVVPDINISRVHAEIHMDPNGSWVVSDLGSTNGLYVNGRKVDAALLRDADMITLGTTTLEFQQLS